MKRKSEKKLSLPTTAQLEAEISRVKYNRKYKQILKSTIYSLIVVAAAAALIATLVLPVLQVAGNSMEPTLNDEEIVLLLRSPELKRGELCCFSYQNQLLLKRVIGLPGDKIQIDEKGNVYVNDKLLDEPYVTDKSLGECDSSFPCFVSDNHYFVLGDHRTTSIDSRSSVIGLVKEDYITGKIFFRIWPLKTIGFVK